MESEAMSRTNSLDARKRAILLGFAKQAQIEEQHRIELDKLQEAEERRREVIRQRQARLDGERDKRGMKEYEIQQLRLAEERQRQKEEEKIWKAQREKELAEIKERETRRRKS